MTDPIKAKIQELCGLQCKGADKPEHFKEACPVNRKITIAVVLRAIEAGSAYVVDIGSDGQFSYWKSPNEGGGRARLGAKWNLEKDYDDQYEPTKQFIGLLLGV